MAQNPYVNRVETADGTTLMDISDTTATEGDVISGKTLYKANGQKSVGTLDINGKADKVANATSGNFAGLDSNGNLTDSGHKHSDYLTSHQDISGKADKVTSATNGDFAGLDSNGNLTDSGKKASDFILATAKGANSGVAELDSTGKVPTSQLPSYVDDVIEAASKNAFPSTGETGKIYVALDTNLTYRWSGSAYVEISPSLALGETDSTAYRGDRGKTAYTHATDSSRLTTAQSSGLYKIATTDEGHVASATAVQKSDITALGIPDDKIYYVKGPSTDTSGVWTGTISGLTAYYEGLMIAYVPAVSGSVSGTTLNINGLGAVGCYANEVNIYNYYPASTPIIFIYNDSRWEMSDANPTKLSNLIPGDGVYFIDNATNGFNLLFQREANWYTPISSGGTTETSKTMLTNAEFNAFGDIMYYNSSTVVSANAGIRGTSALYWSLNSVDLRYVFNIGTETLTTNLPVYLVVTPTSGDKCKIASTTPWAQSLPNTQDGKWYIYLGVSLQTSSNRINLSHNHPVYYHDGTAIRELSPGVHSVQATIDGKLLPSVTSSDNGKVLTVSNGDWAAANPETELPSVTSSDNGKVLTVANGAWSAQDPTGGAPTTLSLTAAAGSWTSATPPTQTLTATGVTASNTIIVGLADDATSEQLEAAKSASIRCTAQGTNEITLTVFGTEPEVNIPVSVVIWG